MANDVRLTTIDNPYNPFIQFDAWLNYDEVVLGYFTCAYLDRVTISADGLSEEDQKQAIEEAIDMIVKINPLGVYKKVYLNPEDETELTD